MARLNMPCGTNWSQVAMRESVQLAHPIFVSRDLATTAGNGFVSSTGQEVNFVTNYFGRGYVPRTYGVTAAYRF
jgi:hypothetical protein